MDQTNVLVFLSSEFVKKEMKRKTEQYNVEIETCCAAPAIYSFMYQIVKLAVDSYCPLPHAFTTLNKPVAQLYH